AGPLRDLMRWVPRRTPLGTLGVTDAAQTQHGPAAARGPGAVLGALAGATLLGTARRLPPSRRLLPHRGCADGARRAAGGRPRPGRPLCRRRSALAGRDTRTPTLRGAGLPADGARLRPLPPAGRARRGRRRREGPRDV